MRLTSCSFTLFVVATSVAAAQHADTQIPIRRLGAPDAVSTERVGYLYGVRELSDGRVLANDAGGRRLILFDRSLQAFTVVADSNTDTHSVYGKRPTGIIPYRGDSTLLTDLTARAFLVVDPAGKVPRVMSPPHAGDVPFLSNPAVGSPGIDAKGRLIYRGTIMPAFKAPEVGKAFVVPEMPDSAPLLRADFETRRVDTLAWIGIPKMKASATTLEGGAVTLRPIINPVAFIDDWAMLPNGGVAILRGRDYHIDWIDSDGARRTSPKMPFDWKRLTDDEKSALIDSTKAALKRQFSDPASAGHANDASGMANHSMTLAPVAPSDGGPAPRSTAMAGMQPLSTAPEVVSPSDLPDYVPPVLRSGTTKADAEGNVWILPSTSAQSAGGLLYDVINRQGELFERVRLPAGRALEGFGAGGVVYLTSHSGGAAQLERARLAPQTDVLQVDTSTARFVGLWEGSYHSDHAPDGPMRVTIAHDSVWTVTMELSMAGQPIPSGRVTSVVVTGNDFSWNHELMGMPCKSSATLDAGVLSGGTSCTQGAITYDLRKK